MKSLQPYIWSYRPQLLLLISTLACILVSIWCLNSGYTIIFQNLFYLPIILACVLYTRRGFLFSCLLALIYLCIIIGYSRDATTLLQAIIRVILFICIAGVITILTISGKKSEEKYRLLAENSYDVIYLMDLTGKFTYVSPSCLRFSGFSPEEILHKSLDQVISPSSLPLLMEEMKKGLEMIKSGTNSPINLIEIELLKKDGTTVWAEVSPQVILDENKKPIGFLGVSRDISKRRIVEQALRENETQFRRIIENVPFSLAIITMEGKIRYINPMGMQFFGFESDEMAYNNSIPRFWADSDQRKAWISQIQSFGMVSDYEMHYKTVTGKEFWMFEFGILIKYQDETCILLTQLDITGRKLAEQAIRESEEKFISIFEETPDPILIIGPDMQIIDFNLGFERVFGLSNKEMKGTRLEDTAFINLASWISDQDINNRSKNSVQHEEMKFVNQSGNQFIAEVTVSSITIQSNPCLIIQIHDIDEIRRAHEAFAQINNKLNILSSITRHDILNRVMVTSFYSEELKKAVTDPKLQNDANKIKISSNEIRDLIEFTRQYQDLGAVAPDWQNVEKILKIREIQGLLKGVTLTSELGGLQIYADMMLEKVIYNLIENSVRHGQNLTQIRLSCHEKAANLVIWYEDDGGGIIQNEKEKAFKKGFGKNTGLGLFLIREILSITGITIIETGEPGVGVRFEISVPAGKFRRGDNCR